MISVELLSVFGDDLMVVNAARVSYGKKKDIIDEKDIKLIKFLTAGENKHTAPFRHPQLQFRITCPIYVERQFFKHSIGLCLSGDSYITFLKSGGCLNLIKLSDLFNKWNSGRSHQNTYKDMEYQRRRIRKMKIRTLNENTGEFELSNIKDIFYSGKKDVYEIKCQNGESVKCSSDHQIYTKNGWKTINSGLSKKDSIGLNGLKYVGTGDYQNYENLLNDRNKGLSVKEISIKYDCSYHTIRKWLKIHNLKFLKEETYFKKDQKPWNFNNGGYKLNLSDEQRKNRSKNSKKNNPKGKKSRLWKGGITPERDKIGQWTRSVAQEIHKKFNFTCQHCGNGSDKLHCHHIIPVVCDITKAYDKSNLITVCKICHEYIHKSAKNEKDFADKVLGEGFTKLVKFGKNSYNRKGNKLKVHFSKIISIKKTGIEDCYDIEIDGNNHNFLANGIVVHNSANSKSGRYVDFSDSYSLISDFDKNKWKTQSKDSKQGSGLPLSDITQCICNIVERETVDCCKRAYEKLIELGVSKEQARTILPLNLNTEFIWTGSLLAFIHLWELRLKLDAQYETRCVANDMLKCVENLEGQPFKYSLEAFNIKSLQ